MAKRKALTGSAVKGLIGGERVNISKKVQDLDILTTEN